jgi:hypothetical protein
MHASHIKTFPGHGSFTSSNLVGETHVPRNAPGTPQANARFRPPGRMRGARMRARRAEEPAPRGRARGRSRVGSGRSRAGAAGEKRLRERDRSSVGLGRSKGLGESRGGLGERAGWLARGEREDPASKTHRWPRTVRPPMRDSADSGGRTPGPPGTNDAIRPAPPPSQKCRGRSAGHAPSRSPHNPRTPAYA